MYKYPELWTHNSLLFPVAMHKITLLLFLVDNPCLTLCSPIDCSKVRLCCPPLHPGVCSNLCSLSQLCFLTISSSVVPFFCLQSFPASGSFPISQFFTSHSQSIGASASSTILPMNIQDWFCFGWMSLISLQSKALSRVSPAPQFKSINFSMLSLLYGPTRTLIPNYWKKSYL